MRVQVVDPSAYTPPYDHSLCAALAEAGAEVELVTSGFAYGAAPAPDGYALSERFYRHAIGAPGSKLRLASKTLEHAPDMLAYRRLASAADVVHFQWLALQAVDRFLLPRRPTVLTAHDLLPREPRPGQVRSQRRLYDAVDAVIAHSEYGRGQLIDRLGVDAAKVRVIHHGAFDYLTRATGELPAELGSPGGPVVLFFGLLRPYKGIDDTARSLAVALGSARRRRALDHRPPADGARAAPRARARRRSVGPPVRRRHRARRLLSARRRGGASVPRDRAL